MTEPKPSYRVRQSEEDIQAEIVQFLFLEGWQVYEFAGPRSRPVCPRCGVIVGRLAGGLPEGWPDILAIKGGGLLRSGHRLAPDYVFLEVKRKGGRRSPAQQELHRELEVFMVTSLEETAAVLKGLGHPLRSKL